MDEASEAAVQLAPRRGTRAAIVGGCGGIGRAVTAGAHSLGLRVCVLDLPQSIEANTLPPQTHAIALDATDELSVERAFQGVEREFGVLDALINLPGFANRTMPVADMASEE